jgi:hypothetical protein|uniref:Orf-40 protein n=1 Tax=Lymantria dispar multicapsid nuclear polyhedrosis virus TaxID=10449 RepID=A0A0D3QWA2_NPVLD|nr:orf-40 protein [Lymantria dispar multiple nucleopolyhedrovirus]AQQ80064.1 hypothetical protein [Lymantria dispar multiple nucleopolyhedrovirus]QIT08088.1 viral ubiquitin like protein [Lymantria dispar multiple nucleopolyhedrovirus]
MNSLRVGQTVFVRIAHLRVYKIHVVDIESVAGLQGALIVAGDDETKFYYKGMRLEARILRIDENFIDLITVNKH